MADKSLKDLQAERIVQKQILDTILKQAKTDKERYAIKKDLADADEKTREKYKEHLDLLKQINDQIQDVKANNKITIDNLINQESKLKGLSGLQSSIVGLDRDRLNLQQKIDTQYDGTYESINSIADMNKDLLAMSAEDVIGRAKQLALIDDSIYALIGQEGVTDDIVENLIKQRDIAESISGLSENQQKFLDKQRAVYEGIEDTIGIILETASLLTSTFGGVLGSAIIGAGYAVEALGENVREMGGYLGGATISSTLLATTFDSAADVTKGLAREMGGLNDVSFQTQLNTNLMATNMGISGDEAATLTGAFARLNGNSAQMAEDMIASTKEFAKQNGVIPSQALADAAAHAEEFAAYGKDGGQNIAEAAVQAAKLGVNMGTLTTITDGLLDFESSITKELELGAMLGKNINLNRARALAYEGKIGASIKETIGQLGGIEAFNQMDIFAKREAAAALGISVEELQKMSANMDKLNDDGTFQKTTFETWNESLTAFATGPLGSTLKGFGSLVIAAGQFNTGLSAMGTSIGGIVKGTGKVLKNLWDMSGGKIMGGLSKMLPSIGGGTTPSGPTPSTNPATGGGIMDSMSKVNMSAVLKGAAAMVLVAGAVFILGKALQEYKSVGLTEIGLAAAGMLILGAAVMGLGMIMSSGVGAVALLAGAAAMIVVAGAIWVLGKAIQEMAIGFAMLGVVGSQLGGLISMIPGIFGLAAAFVALGASLGILGTVGVMALPVLLGLGVAGAGLGMLVSAFGGSGGETSGVEGGSISEYEETMLQKMDTLISAVSNNKNVYLDKDKVTSLVISKGDRSIVNKLNINNA